MLLNFTCSNIIQLYFLLPYHFYYGYIIFHASLSLCCLIKIIIISVYEVTNVINSYVFSLPLCLTGECTIIKNWLLTPACLLLCEWNMKADSSTWRYARLWGAEDEEERIMKDVYRCELHAIYLHIPSQLHHHHKQQTHLTFSSYFFWASWKSLWHQMVMYIVYFRYFSLFILFYFVCFIEVNT